MGNNRKRADDTEPNGRWHFFFEDDSDEPTIVWVRPPKKRRRTHEIKPPPAYVRMMPLPCQREGEEEE